MTWDANDSMNRSNSLARSTALLSQGINVVRALEARGIDATALLRQVGCDPALFHVPETRVPNHVIQRAFELAEEARGLRFVVLYAAPRAIRPMSRQDAVLAGILQLCRITFGGTFVPLAATVVREPPADPRRFEDGFRAPIVWGAPQPSLLCRRENLARPLATTNPGVAVASEKHVADYLARLDRDDVVARVKRELLGYFPAGTSTQAAIARAVGLRARTLHRRLAEAGTAFEKLLDETRHELGAEYVRRTDYSVGEVAYLLGFAETSSFSRAFRRWTGKSPSEFRRAGTPAQTTAGMD